MVLGQNALALGGDCWEKMKRKVKVPASMALSGQGKSCFCREFLEKALDFQNEMRDFLNIRIGNVTIIL
jgi:hypothetical protein